MSARQFVINSTSNVLNGNPVFLGVLTSNGTTAVNNATTAVPFFTTPATAPGASNTISPVSLNGTLAGKTLLLQTSTNGNILPMGTADIGASAPTVVAITTTPAALLLPGPLLVQNERIVIVMGFQHGWLQWLSSGGSGNLLVWELR